MVESMQHQDSLLLAIEASQRDGSVALSRGLEPLGCVRFPCGARHEDGLLPSIDQLFRDNGLHPSDLDVIAVSTGPGGFTGLRIAVGTAKGIAETTGCDTVSVPSSFVVAEHLRGTVGAGSAVLVASAAKQGTCWLSRLECLDEGWMEVEPACIHVVDPPSPEAIALAQDAVVVADEHVPEAFKSAVSDVALDVVAPCLDAEACAVVATWMHQRGQNTDPLDLKPLYPREPEAVRSWRLRNG